MAAPTKKTSKARTRRRFATYTSEQRKKLANGLHLTTCTHCGAPARMHHACMACGHYKGTHVLDVAKTKKVTKIEA